MLENFWEEYPDMLREQVRSALGSFLFSQEEVEKKMGQLSGGEKVRLALCKLFQTKPNLLILDEPTNHMDMLGKEALEQMLKDYEGTVLFVSHDRYFISQVATGILEFASDASGEAVVTQYRMPYEEYLQEKGRKVPVVQIPRQNVTPAKSAAEPTLSDVFDKKTYYNPGKIKSRLTKQLEKYEKQLAESEERANELKLQLMDPSLGTDYEKLMTLQSRLEEEEHQQETLLERMLETETELEELNQDAQ